MEEVEGLMVMITVHCPHCRSEEIMRAGRAPNGKQKYRCRACKRQSRENPTPHAYPEERREENLKRIKSVVVYVDLSERLGFHVFQ